MSAFLGGAFKVLVVEDDDSLRGIAEEHLTRAGYDVRAVATGWEGVNCLREDLADVVVVEWDVATSDGSGLREKFVLNPGARSVPFVYLVPEGFGDQLNEGLRSGIDDCLVKPIDPVMLVARVQAAVEHRRVYEEMVRVDMLTHLLNRRTLESKLVEEVARVRRYKRFASFVLIDIDDFSKLNEEQGQAMGDLLLTSLGGMIRTSIRNIDIAGRYQGDKFLLYLPETRAPGAHILIGRILDRFRETSDVMTGLVVTFSAAILEAPRDGVELSALCERAEAAVAFSKASGKGRIILGGEDLAGAEPT